MFGLTERIDEVRDKIFFGGFFLDDFFFVFNDYFVVGDLGDFGAGDGEFGVDKTFDKWALDDDLLNGKIFASEGKIRNFTKFGTFFGLYFEANGVKI